MARTHYNIEYMNPLSDSDEEILECIEHINSFINTRPILYDRNEFPHIIADIHHISSFIIQYGHLYDIYVLISSVSNVVMLRQNKRSMARFETNLYSNPFLSAFDYKCNEFDQITLLGYMFEKTFILYINNNAIIKTISVKEFEDMVYDSLDVDELEKRMNLDYINDNLRLYDPLYNVRELLFEIAVSEL